MDENCRKLSIDDEENVITVGILTPKNQLLNLYPNAYCVFESNCLWRIRAVDGTSLGFSFASENIAWDWALAKINHRILQKFQGINNLH
jgi:hypothetical protein